MSRHHWESPRLQAGEDVKKLHMVNSIGGTGMGLCNATKIFDSVCESLLKEPPNDKKEVLKTLILALEDIDWDCQQDSVFWDNPVVNEIMRELHPNWFDDVLIPSK